MYLPFNHLPKFPKLANFEILRKQLSHLYTLINRLISGKTYIDLFSAQAIATPITGTNGNLLVNPSLSIDSVAHVWNKYTPETIVAVVTGDFEVSDNSKFLPGMPVIYTTTGTPVQNVFTNESLTNGGVYWIHSTSYQYISLSKVYGDSRMSLYLDGSDPNYPEGPTTGTLTPAFPLTRIKDTTLLPRNNTYPTPVDGNLAYGDLYQGTKASLYYYHNGTHRPVKLGWNGGNGYYNNNSTYAQKYTGWCHGIGKYKIVTSTNQIKVTFDAMEVREPITGARDVVSSSRTTPSSNYSVLLTNTSAGLNSIDTGVFLSNSGYYIYLLYCPEDYTYGLVASLAHDMPEFPINDSTGTQYRYYQRLGWIRTDSDGAFFPSLQVGKDLVFYQKPDNVASIAFQGGGTSVDVDLYSLTIKDSDKYPYVGYLSTADIYLNWTGTGYNRGVSNRNHIVSFNSVPTYGISQTGGTTSTQHPANFVFNDTPLPIGQPIRISIAHPNDTGGTDYSNIGFAMTGFRFNGELYV